VVARMVGVTVFVLVCRLVLMLVETMLFMAMVLMFCPMELVMFPGKIGSFGRRLLNRR
jgi:hypothetical protein